MNNRATSLENAYNLVKTVDKNATDDAYAATKAEPEFKYSERALAAADLEQIKLKKMGHRRIESSMPQLTQPRTL